jgi:hypothetical protein
MTGRGGGKSTWYWSWYVGGSARKAWQARQKTGWVAHKVRRTCCGGGTGRRAGQWPGLRPGDFKRSDQRLGRTNY